jgi:4-amino-4-deoxy-L-arabinose transferase-like glycosyltransferase
MTSNSQSVNYFLFVLFLLISLAIRIWLLDGRWINPDEGAHLMDGFLTLKGYVPEIDFIARQPFYVFVNALWLKLWGVNYLAGRLLPMTLSLLTAMLVYVIARKLYNERIALLAFIIYLMLPLEIMNSVIVKTEPLANFLSCLSILLLVKFAEGQRKMFLALSGMVAALGYYTRESTMVLPILAIFFIIATREHSIADTSYSLGAYLLGYGLVVVAFLSFYAQFLGFNELVSGNLNPIGFVLGALKKFAALVELGGNESASGGVTEVVGTKTRYSFHYLKWTVYLHSFLFLGVAWAAVRIFYPLGSKAEEGKRFRNGYLLLVSWLALLTAAYMYHYKTFGYYIDYFREFLPFVSILFAAFLYETIFAESSDKSLLYSVILTAFGLAVIFLVEKSLFNMPKGLQIVGTIGAVAVVMILRSKKMKSSKILIITSMIALALFYLASRNFGWGSKNPILLAAAAAMVIIAFFSIANRWRFLNIAVILGLMVLSTSFAGNVMGLSYDSIWSISAVKKISDVIAAHSEADDEVLSGAVIWELEANRLPFERISHPLAYSYFMPHETSAKIERRMEQAPPKIVVFDGYTEKTYLKHLDWLPEVVENKYKMIEQNEEAKYPIRVFVLK